jgi:sugar-specific transcriptional regulator TrmB
MNKFDIALDSARKEWCIVTTPKLAPLVTSKIREKARNIIKKGIKTRVIIDSNTDEATRKLLDRLDHSNKFLEARQISDAFLVPYRIVDEEVWITLTKETESGLPWFLWTDAPNIVKFYKKNFERAWESPAAKSL